MIEFLLGTTFGLVIVAVLLVLVLAVFAVAFYLRISRGPYEKGWEPVDHDDHQG